MNKDKIIMEERFMSKAIKEAKKALAINEVPIGAIIVKDNKIISRAYNKKEKMQDATKHAEIIAIEKASKKLNNYRLENCEMYVTLEPCMMCAGAIIASRIKKVYFGAKDEKYGAILSNINALDMKSNHKVEVESGIKEIECKQMLQDFFKKLRKK